MNPPTSSTTPPTAASQLECPECAASISVTRQPLCGEVLRCAECQAELEVVSVSPLRVELAPEVQEDWGE